MSIGYVFNPFEGNFSPINTATGVNVYDNFAGFPPTSFTGDLGVAADSGIIYEYTGASWMAIAAPGDALSLGAFGSTPNADGLSITSNVLNMQPADATHPGGISTTTQSFAGNKTFTGQLHTSFNTLEDGSGNAAFLTASTTQLKIDGAGIITIENDNGGGTSYNFILPNDAGTAGELLTSQAGGSSPMTWTDIGSIAVTSLTGDVTGTGPGATATSLVATTNATLTTLSGLTTASALTSIGTIATGTWAGTTVATNHGGTGVTSLANFTDSTSGADGITVTGGSGAVVTSTSIAQHVADTTHNGYLTSTDWNTFNGKQAAGNYPIASAGDLNETSFSLANNQSSAANITGLAFANATVRSADIKYSCYINATTSLYETGILRIVQNGTSWYIARQDNGDDSQLVFSVTNAGQVQYTSPNYTGFSSGKFSFRSITTSV